MNPSSYKIGYSDLGRIYIGENIKSEFHKHHLVAIILSDGEPFEITRENSQPELYEAVLIQKDTCCKLETGEKNDVVFSHIERTEQLLQAIVSIVVSGTPGTVEMDSRVVKCIQQIKQSDSEKISIQQMAELVYLSASRLSHLFKEEPGLTFRQFVLHRKLVKSLHAMVEQHNFTELNKNKNGSQHANRG